MDSSTSILGSECSCFPLIPAVGVMKSPPHVDNIFRVGCMRNLSVIVQEFGRAGRSGNDADGFLLLNESKDDSTIEFLDTKLPED